MRHQLPDLTGPPTPSCRVLDDAFTSIRQAMAVPRDKPADAEYVQDFIKRRLREGFVRGALLASGQTDVSAER